MLGTVSQYCVLSKSVAALNRPPIEEMKLLCSSEATFAEPHRYPTGIPYVIVNGDVLVDAGRFRAAGGGRVLTPR